MQINSLKEPGKEWKDMVFIKLLKYKIKRLCMTNTVQFDCGRIQISDSSEFRLNVSNGSCIAKGTLTVSIGSKECFSGMGIQLEMEGYFGLEGIEDLESKKETHMRCYDAIFPYADQIVKILAMNSEMKMIALRKSRMDGEKIHIKAVEEGSEVIEFAEKGEYGI